MTVRIIYSIPLPPTTTTACIFHNVVDYILPDDSSYLISSGRSGGGEGLASLICTASTLKANFTFIPPFFQYTLCVDLVLSKLTDTAAPPSCSVSTANPERFQHWEFYKTVRHVLGLAS